MAMKPIHVVNAMNALARLQKEEAARTVRVGEYSTPDSDALDAEHLDNSAEDMENIKNFARQALERIRGQNVQS